MDTYVAGSTIYQSFNTHKADGTPITLAGTPSLAVYKDDGTTEDTGDITLNVDFDSKTGLHNFKIDTSQDGTFYATGHTFQVVIAAGTVDSVSQVGAVVYVFRLGNIPSEVKAIANDAITAAAFDESTAFPLKAADSSTTILARAGDKMDIADAPSATGLAALADAILTRAFSSVTYTGTTRCVLTALQAVRNKFTTTTGAAGYVVKKEDDSTTSWTGTLTVDGSGVITGMDPDA